MRLTLIACLALLGCAAAPGPDPRAGLTRAAIDAMEVPFTLVEGPALAGPVALVPVGENRGVTTWGDGGGVTVALGDGLLVRTHGLAEDLVFADVRGTAAALAGGSATYVRVQDYIDGDGDLRRRAFECRMTAEGAERLMLQGLAVETRRAREVCSDGETRIANRYWRDASGRVWQSDQWAGPVAGMLHIERWSR